MSRERVEVVRRLFEAWNRDDADALVSACHPDVTITTRTSRIQGEPYRGHAGVRRWLAEAQESFEYMEPSYDELREVGERVLAFGRVRTKGKESGVKLDDRLAWVCGFRDGKLFRMAVFEDPGEALEAAGLRE
jgi:ketosteroid isomerase-like protein